MCVCACVLDRCVCVIDVCVRVCDQCVCVLDVDDEWMLVVGCGIRSRGCVSSGGLLVLIADT